jgi:uncharacterized Zn finger protein
MSKLRKQEKNMDYVCDCGTEIMFPTPERDIKRTKDGKSRETWFVTSTAVCPECGQVYNARIMKAEKKRKEEIII